MAFESNLKAVRKLKGWSQKDAATKIGIKLHNLGAYEEGRSSPPMDKLKLILEGYSIPQKDTYNFLFDEYQMKST